MGISFKYPLGKISNDNQNENIQMLWFSRNLFTGMYKHKNTRNIITSRTTKFCKGNKHSKQDNTVGYKLSQKIQINIEKMPNSSTIVRVGLVYVGYSVYHCVFWWCWYRVLHQNKMYSHEKLWAPAVILTLALLVCQFFQIRALLKG